MARFEDLKFRRLSDGAPVVSFDCGDPDLNDFLLKDALLYEQQLLGVTYVFENEETQQTAAFFTVSNDRISVEDTDNKASFNDLIASRLPNDKQFRYYPAVKIGRLGVDKDFRGKGIGIKIIRVIADFFTYKNKTGCRYITVDAYNNPASMRFYERALFFPLKEKDAGRRTRLLFFDLYDYVR